MERTDHAPGRPLRHHRRAPDCPGPGGEWGTDYTGLWYNPNESGWGLNVIQQQEIIFATLFVYGTDNRATWYVASDLTFTGTDSAGAPSFSGTLYQTSGPYFGAGSFNASTVTITPVGSMTIRFAALNVAQLSYTVGGVAVGKVITPQTFRNNNLNGSFVGGSVGTPNGCALPVQPAAMLGIDIVHSGSNATLTLTGANNSRCTLTGTVTQTGKLANIDGTYSCNTGTSGPFAIRRLEVGVDGLMGLYLPATQNCSADAVTIGGARSR